MIHEFALLGSGQEIRHRIHAHGNIGEKPGEFASLADQVIDICFTADDIGILAGIAARSAKWKLFAAQEFHGLHRFAVSAFPAAGICFLFKTLHTDGGDEVTHFQHAIGKGFVNQRPIGESQKHTILVRLTHFENISLAYHGFSA